MRRHHEAAQARDGLRGGDAGIDLDALVGVSRRAQEIVGCALPGQIVKAGRWSRRYPLPDGVQSRLAAE